MKNIFATIVAPILTGACLAIGFKALVFDEPQNVGCLAFLFCALIYTYYRIGKEEIS